MGLRGMWPLDFVETEPNTLELLQHLYMASSKMMRPAFKSLTAYMNSGAPIGIPPTDMVMRGFDWKVVHQDEQT